MLKAELAFSRAEFSLQLALAIDAGETLAIVGQNGVGKSTLLALLAGLLRVHGGFIRLGKETYADARRGAHVPPQRRSIGYVFQDYALFPHLSVEQNVAFGLHAQGISRRVVAQRTASIMAQLGIGSLAARPASELSGGQKQRVALARALVLEPRLLLLDEPLAALDTSSRARIAAELAAQLAQLRCVTLLVTHSFAEARLFARRIGVMQGGRLLQIGTAEQLRAQPKSEYVAQLVAQTL